jgi:two-component system sensor histidine kinase/response regulator
VHKLLARQLRAAARKDGGGIDIDALLAILDQTYDEFDRERRLNDRAATLMETELKAANAQAKREHDAVLKAILANASDGMLVVRDDGAIEIANAAAERQFVASPSGMSGLQLEKLLGPAANAIANGETNPEFATDIFATALDGRVFPVEFSVAALDMWGGRRQLWIVRDISERVRSQREIMESRLRFQDFAEASSDCFWEMDSHLKHAEISSAADSDVSARLKSLLTAGVQSAKPEGISKEGWRALRHHLSARTRFRLRLDLQRDDGAPLYLSLSGKPVFDLEGQFKGYRGTARDVTREVTARVAARRAERRLIEAMDAAPSAVALVDSRFELAASNSALRMLVAGERHADTDSFATLLTGALRTGRADGNMEPAEFVRALAASREMREIAIGASWYLLAARGLSDGGMVLNFSDVTALKQREGELAEAKLAAESANRLKSQFLATMSHELRTPLNAILGFSEVIRDGVFGHDVGAWGKYCEYANFIHTSGKHLLSLISEILDLSKIEAGSYVLDVARIDLRDILEGALAILSPVAKKAGVDLRTLPPGDPVWLTADERAMRQITLNILANAVKFTPNGGHVGVELSARDGVIECAISDTGIGIAHEHVESVFEPFCQVDSSIRRRHEGTGLGLAITKRLVEMHGGTIAIESEIAVGTTVHIRLPAVAGTALPGKTPSKAA